MRTLRALRNARSGGTAGAPAIRILVLMNPVDPNLDEPTPKELMSTEKEAKEVTEANRKDDLRRGSRQQSPERQDFHGDDAKRFVELEETGATGHSGHVEGEK